MKIPIIISAFFIAGCTFSKKSSWQGIYYPQGCLTCVSEYVYSPVFKTFNECKSWADSKIKGSEEKAACSRNCEFEGKYNMSKCDLVVRSWFIPLISDSPTFNSYKE